MANPILSGIPAYVDQTKEELISKAVLGGDSAKLFNLMVGVKGETELHLLATDVTIQDGKSCGFSAAGTQTITARKLKPAVLKVNMEYCEKDFLGSYAAHNLRLAAGQETLPYEEKFIGEVINAVNAKVEKMVFQGSTDNGAEFDGLIKILTGTAVSASAGSTKWETVKNVYSAIPETEISKDDCVIMVSPAFFRGLVQELIAANLYHYNENDASGEIYLPGTNCKIMSRNGLAGTERIIAGSLSNIFYGTDMSGDEEVFDFWYSKDAQLFKLNILFSAGVQVAYPDLMVLL